jgi:hypothetical protein
VLVKCFSRIHKQSAAERFNFPLHSVYLDTFQDSEYTTFIREYSFNLEYLFNTAFRDSSHHKDTVGKARVKFYLAGVSLFLDEQIRRTLQNRKGLYVLFRNAASHKGLYITQRIVK